MILVFGSINMDLVASVAAIPRPGETVLSRGYCTLFGGKGANQAVAAARVSEGRVAMVARVGRDSFGEACLANLKENGVATEHILAGDDPTGCAFITVDAAGENAITVASGANGAVSASDLPDALVGADTLLVMQMEVPLDASLATARRVKAAGGRTIWNFAPAIDLSAGELADVLTATDIFIVNEHEALTAAGLLGTSASDLEAAARTLAVEGRVTCVATAGAAGAIAYQPDGTRHHAPALDIRPVDTTGAGDTFVGILAAEIAAGSALTEALRLASIGASLACLKVGAQAGMPTRAELEQGRA
ncbi:ribokinase [Starkeya sp. ORNL1]|uniref:ribokinase n=1 Tax=Starkeya sp. ORNL1 TaxID=2709380 RepID=UPI00146282F1|nr:ribokinase [Starkeya sp. ORNL1]QJP14110.1 ribokinase [Starkeya sp. ORNL1]